MSPILFHVLPFLLLGLSASVCFVDEISLAGYRYPSSSAMPMMGMVQLAYGYWDTALRMSMAIGVTRFSPSLPILSLLYLLQPAPVSADLTSLPDGTPCGSCTIRADVQSPVNLYNTCSDWVSFIESCPQDCSMKTPPGFTHPFQLGDGAMRDCGSHPDFTCAHACGQYDATKNELVVEGCCFKKDSAVGHIHCFFLYHWYFYIICWKTSSS